MVYVMIVSILAAGVWSHIKMVAAQAKSAYDAAREQALAELRRQEAHGIVKDSGMPQSSKDEVHAIIEEVGVQA